MKIEMTGEVARPPLRHEGYCSRKQRIQRVREALEKFLELSEESCNVSDAAGRRRQDVSDYINGWPKKPGFTIEKAERDCALLEGFADGLLFRLRELYMEAIS